MENPVGGSAAPTASPSTESPTPRLTLDEFLATVGSYRLEYRPDRPPMVYDEFGHVGYVDSEGFVVPVPIVVEAVIDPNVCPMCGRPR